MRELRAIADLPQRLRGRPRGWSPCSLGQRCNVPSPDDTLSHTSQAFSFLPLGHIGISALPPLLAMGEARTGRECDIHIR